jgi:hypothetical protein
MAHAAIGAPATEWADGMYDTSLVSIQELACLIGLPSRGKSRYVGESFTHTHNRPGTCQQVFHRELNQIVMAEMGGDHFNIGWDQICQ